MSDAEQPQEKYEPEELKVVTADTQVHAARFHPNGNLLAAGSYDSRVRLWDVSADEPAELPSLTGHHAWVQAICFSPNGEFLYTSDSWGQLCAWDFRDEKPHLAWHSEGAHDGWIRDVDVSPDGKRVVTCGRDRVVRVWNSTDGVMIYESRNRDFDLYCSRFHPSGELIVTGDDRGVVVVANALTGEAVREFDASVLYLEHRLQDVGGVRALSFDREGKTLAVGGTTPKNGATVQGTPTVLLFDFESGELKQTLNFGATNHCFVHETVIHDDGFVMAVTSGTPGQGQIVFQNPDDEKPFFAHTKIPNCHSISLHSASGRFAVAATNRGSNGNGRRLNEDGEYAGNHSPIHLFQLPTA